MAALSGGSAAPQNYEDLLLSGAAAALLGGISLYGGRGTVLTSRSASRSCRWSAPGSPPAGSAASVIQLVTGALLLTVVGLEFLAAASDAFAAAPGRGEARVAAPARGA